MGKKKKDGSAPAPERIFAWAERCNRVERVLHGSLPNDEDGDVVLFLPVMYAFVAELYLKCILVCLGRPNWQGHDLEKLFVEIRIKDLQNEILSGWIRQNNPLPERARAVLQKQAPEFDWGPATLEGWTVEFQKQLKATSKQFIEWRYMFEHEGLPSSGDIQNAIPAMRRIARRLVEARKLSKE